MRNATNLDQIATYSKISFRIASDSDTSDVLTVTSAAISNGALGTVTTDGNTVTYNPGTAYNYLAVGETANVVIGYSISDLYGGTSSSTLTVTVTGNNDGPTANADSGSTFQDTSVTINVLANDSDPDTSDVLVVAGVTQPAHGAVVQNANGTLTYTPGIGCECTSDSFTYTISDGHGGTATATVTMAILPYSGVSSAEGILRVGGTDAADVVTVSGGDLIVNGTPHSLAGVTEVRVWGYGGQDTIDLSGLLIKSFVSGGDDNDSLIGGSAEDVIFGGMGDDTITGGAGNDFLIGGEGKDRIVGSAGHDILVAGDIDCGLDLAALRAISQAWADSHTQVSAEETEGSLDDSAVDDAFDVLTGSAGADLFLISAGDKITDFQLNKPNTNKDGDVVVTVS